MKLLLFCMWTWMSLVSKGCGSLGCWEEERNALLKIKATFNHPNGSSLPSWRNGNSDCCGWEGVKCDNTTSRVTELCLRAPQFWALELLPPRVIDASFFLPLEELQVLDLSESFISGVCNTDRPN
ncbi:hypothetical protein BT93_E2060 [Corymbia citriodora subsp. variegata]|nr:hypothetical protein BT93_E2060 [Corymbia citriodora subsp. variegata]